MDTIGLWAALALIIGLAVAEGGLLPDGAASLSSVIEIAQKSGCGSVTEITFDDGRWEVEALRNGQPVGLLIDAEAREVLGEHPDEPHPQLPTTAKSAFEIACDLEQAGYAPLRKLEFEITHWEATAKHHGQWRELKLSPTGQMVADVLKVTKR